MGKNGLSPKLLPPLFVPICAHLRNFGELLSVVKILLIFLAFPNLRVSQCIQLILIEMSAAI